MVILFILYFHIFHKVKSFYFSYIYFPGETDDSTIKAIRSRQMKNFHLALMISQVSTENQFLCHIQEICYFVFMLVLLRQYIKIVKLRYVYVSKNSEFT